MQNVWTSAVNPRRSNKNASLWPEAQSFRSTPNGMMPTIWFFNSNFRVFHVNGKHPCSSRMACAWTAQHHCCIYQPSMNDVWLQPWLIKEIARFLFKKSMSVNRHHAGMTKFVRIWLVHMSVAADLGSLSKKTVVVVNVSFSCFWMRKL